MKKYVSKVKNIHIAHLSMLIPYNERTIAHYIPTGKASNTI
jgi:hypothetical protein